MVRFERFEVEKCSKTECLSIYFAIVEVEEMWLEIAACALSRLRHPAALASNLRCVRAHSQPQAQISLKMRFVKVCLTAHVT